MLSHVLRAASLPTLLTYISSGAITSTTSTYTFTNQNIGTASSDRLVIVGIMHNTASLSQQVTSVKIGGVSATSIIAPSAGVALSLFTIKVTTGTTATIVVTLNGNAVNCGIQVYTLKNYNSATPNFTTTNAVNSPPQSVTATANTVVMAMATTSTTATTITWSAPVVLDNTTLVGAGNRIVSVGSFKAYGSTNSVTFTDNGNGTTRELMVAGWR